MKIGFLVLKKRQASMKIKTCMILNDSQLVRQVKIDAPKFFLIQKI